MRRRGGGRRQRQNYTFVILQYDRSRAEVQTVRAAAHIVDRAQPVSKPNGCAAPTQESQRRVHERLGESRFGNSRPAGALSFRESLSQHRPQ